MPYEKTMDEIIKLIKPGMKAFKRGEEFIFKSYINDDDSKSFKLQIVNSSKETAFSFKILYNKELIDDDGNIFKKIDRSDASFGKVSNNTSYNMEILKVIEELRANPMTNRISHKSYNDLLNEVLNSEPENHVFNSDDSGINNYSDLKRFFFQYDLSNRCEFYQYTAVDNAINIIKSGFIMSRDSAINHIKYDNIIMNDTTDDVMSSNSSTRIEKYVRFYFNIRNKATYNMLKNFESKHTFGVIFAIEYSSIWHNQKVFVTPISAHYSTNSDFEWSGNNCKDISNIINLKNLKTKSFNFKKTFEEYDREEKNYYQMAEILFYDKISIDYVSHIYFASQNDLNSFLSRLNDMERKRIISKCEVNEYLHWR